jgi:hypothetical protein
MGICCSICRRFGNSDERSKDSGLCPHLRTLQFQVEREWTYQVSSWYGFTRASNGGLCIESKNYLKKMMDTHERQFCGRPQHTYHFPLEKGYHPEKMDTTDSLDQERIMLYQSLIGALQWVVTIGHFDIRTAVANISGFRAVPRVGHLDRVKRIYDYLNNMDQAKIRVRWGIL